MTGQTVDGLLARVDELERRLGEAHPTREPETRGRWPRRRMAIAALVALALAVPVGVFASHSFTDVPNSNTFHTQIGRVAGAGITAGCTATTFCPSADVTRGQMAAFLARSAGRVAEDDFVSVVLTDSASTIATVTIKAGDVTGGTALVVLDAAVSAYNADLSSCPCGAVFYLLNAGGSQLGWPAYSSQTVANSFGGGVGSVSITAVVSVPTGVAQTYRLGGFETLGTAEDTTLFGTLTATYVPFLGDGTNPAVLAPPIAPDDPVLNPAGN